MLLKILLTLTEEQEQAKDSFLALMVCLVTIIMVLILRPKNIILTAYDQDWLMLTEMECWTTPNLFNSSQRS